MRHLPSKAGVSALFCDVKTVSAASSMILLQNCVDALHNASYLTLRAISLFEVLCSRCSPAILGRCLIIEV